MHDDEVAKQSVIHCDLSPLNINFHNQLDKTLVPYALDFVIGGSATFAKEELRSMFGYQSKGEKHFTSIGGYAMMFSPPRPLMHSRETGGYLIPKLALAIWGKCTNKTTYFCGDNPN